MVHIQGIWQELSRELSLRECLELLLTCVSLTSRFVLRRTNRWLRELLERERLLAEKSRLDDRQREFYRQKETVRTLFEASQIGSALTLDELLANTELDFSVKSSATPSDPPASLTTQTTNKPRP